MLFDGAQSREAVLAFFAFTYSAAEHMRHELLPVADAEYGNALGKDGWIDRRAAALIYAVRSAGNYQTPAATEFARRSFARPHFRRDAKVANLSSDEMTILPARVQDG